MKHRRQAELQAPTDDRQVKVTEGRRQATMYVGAVENIIVLNAPGNSARHSDGH